MSTIGAGIVHGPSYINIYNNPVVYFQLKKRSLSRAVRVRRVKRGLVAGGGSQAPGAQSTTIGSKQIPALQLDSAGGPLSPNGLGAPTDEAATLERSPQVVNRVMLATEQDSTLEMAAARPSSPPEASDPAGTDVRSKLGKSGSNAQFFATADGKRDFADGRSSNQATWPLGVSSIQQARRLKHEKELQTRQLYNRISILQAEEERAVKKIEETRIKAQQMLEYKLQQEQMVRERQEQKAVALNRARDLVQEKRAEATIAAAKVE